MKRTAWIVGAFAAGLIVSATTAPTRADMQPMPVWVTQGSCFVMPAAGTEVALEIQGQWVRTSRGEDGSETWRNLAEAPWLGRPSAETCRQVRDKVARH